MLTSIAAKIVIILLQLLTSWQREQQMICSSRLGVGGGVRTGSGTVSSGAFGKFVTLLPRACFQTTTLGGEVFFRHHKSVSNQSWVSVNAIYVPTKVNAASVIELAGT